MTLVALTAASIVVAIVCAFAAWRMRRDEASRSRARIAALAEAALDADAPSRAPAAEAPVSSPSDDDLPSAWSFPPRVTPLAATVRAQAVAPQAHPRAERSRWSDLEPGATTPHGGHVDARFLTSAAPTGATNRHQRWLAVAAAVLLTALAGGGAWIAAGAWPVDTAEAPPAASPSALELLRLNQERQGATLAVSGFVRNPAGGQRIERLSAVVSLLDQAGRLVTSRHALVDALELGPGQESPFVVQMDAPPNAARYRVSFRTDRGVVSHVDRRAEPAVAPASFERPPGGSAGR